LNRTRRQTAEEEKQVMQQLHEVEARRAKVDADAATVESEEAAQRALRAKYWQELNEFRFQLQVRPAAT
jgi:flagellar biosynthesis/type III secretory pathway chaperone